jgi:hypothetical protein
MMPLRAAVYLLVMQQAQAAQELLRMLRPTTQLLQQATARWMPRGHHQALSNLHSQQQQQQGRADVMMMVQMQRLRMKSAWLRRRSRNVLQTLQRIG